MAPVCGTSSPAGGDKRRITRQNEPVHDQVLLYLNLLAAAVIDASIALGLLLQGPDAVRAHPFVVFLTVAALPVLLVIVIRQHRQLVAVMP
jgi:hypothetical protein